jgi:hypothetical protein
MKEASPVTFSHWLQTFWETGGKDDDNNNNKNKFNSPFNSLCALVVRVPGYRSRSPGSIPCATRFSEK